MAIIRSTSSQAYEFACHSAACAPPPAGTGGSSGGGRSGRPVRPNPIGPGAKANPNQGMIDKTIRDAEGKARSKTNDSQIQASDLKKGDRVVFAQQAKTVSSVGMQGNGKIGISFTTGGVTDLRPDQTLPRAAAARAPKVSVNQSGRAGKFIAARAPDKKWAMNPNNPRNQQRHPDDDRASKKIIRP